jgi:nicotinamidase-related amidase
MKDLQSVENLLVVVDVINGFINEGNMKDEYISHIVPGVEMLVKEYSKKENNEVFYIRDSHKRDSIEFKKFPLHCLEGSRESEVVDELKPYEPLVRTYLKNSTSAIFAKGLLEDLMKMENLKKVTVVGCCSDICVINFALPLVNYLDENNLEVEVEVKEDLIETYNAPSHDRDEFNALTMKLLKQAGIKVNKSEVKKNER